MHPWPEHPLRLNVNANCRWLFPLERPDWTTFGSMEPQAKVPPSTQAAIRRLFAMSLMCAGVVPLAPVNVKTLPPFGKAGWVASGLATSPGMSEGDRLTEPSVQLIPIALAHGFDFWVRSKIVNRSTANLPAWVKS